MRSVRCNHGSSILELGPSLLILLFFILFPLMDGIAMMLQYSAGWYLNSMSSHEVACVKQANWQTALNQQTSIFCQSGLGAFLHLNAAQITQTPALVAAATPPAVGVTTTLPITPLLIVPVPGTNIPGINQPINVTFYSERQREETR